MYCLLTATCWITFRPLEIFQDIPEDEHHIKLKDVINEIASEESGDYTGTSVALWSYKVQQYSDAQACSSVCNFDS
jgi:hypothetical protein